MTRHDSPELRDALFNLLRLGRAGARAMCQSAGAGIALAEAAANVLKALIINTLY
jgi:hypothetical protein